MEEQTFNLLAELLRPILSHNDYYAKQYYGEIKNEVLFKERAFP